MQDTPSSTFLHSHRFLHFNIIRRTRPFLSTKELAQYLVCSCLYMLFNNWSRMLCFWITFPLVSYNAHGWVRFSFPIKPILSVSSYPHKGFNSTVILMTLIPSSSFLPQKPAQISACLADISSWMTSHQLKLNPSKTKLPDIPGDVILMSRSCGLRVQLSDLTICHWFSMV